MAEAPPERTDKRSMRAIGTGLTRFIILVPVVSLFVGALTLVIVGGITTVSTILTALGPGLTSKQVMVSFIELADLFLLAVVLYMMSVGLYELFIDPDVALPDWLQFNDIDDLKHRLAAVVVVVLGVIFLGFAVNYSSAKDLALQGVGIAAVIFALAYFLKIGGRE